MLFCRDLNIWLNYTSNVRLVGARAYFLQCSWELKSVQRQVEELLETAGVAITKIWTSPTALEAIYETELVSHCTILGVILDF